MIRFIIKRKFKGDPYAAGTETFETFTVDVPELEAALTRGGVSQNGYDISELMGAEVFAASARSKA